MNKSLPLGGVDLCAIQRDKDGLHVQFLMVGATFGKEIVRLLLGGDLFSLMLGIDVGRLDFSVNLLRLHKTNAPFVWSGPLATALIVLGWLLIGQLDWRYALLGIFLWWAADFTIPRKSEKKGGER